MPLARSIRRAVLAGAITLLGSARPIGALAAVIAPAAMMSPLQAAASPDAASHPYAPHVAQASLRFGIPENWIWAVMRQESGGNPRATSPVGAQGLMQIMPGTWAMLAARYDLGSNAYDVRANIFAGAAYLRMMWDRYRDVRLMLAAYNAGPGRVDAYAARRRGLPLETVNYVARIAPSIGASGGASVAPAPAADVQSWRNASVFIAHKEGSSEPSHAPSAAPPSRASSEAGELRPARSSSLFFAIGNGGQ